jgi:hypothetical protein
MPELVANAFLDEAKKPTNKAVSSTLGVSAEVWNGLMEFIREEHGPIIEEWKFMKSGWVLVPKKKTRTVCYLFPASGFFTVAFVLGEKAVEVARKSKLPKRVIDLMEAARPYAEGRGFRVQVAKPTDLKWLKTLVTIKMEN